MRFQVPQFIEIEDKIFGPLTFKQFVYLAGGGGLSVLIWFLLPTLLAVPLILASAGLGIALAFMRVNEKPFIEVMQSAVFYVLNRKLYIWKKENKITEGKIAETGKENEIYIPKLSESKLKELSWALDVEDLSKRSKSEEEKTRNDMRI